LDSQWWILSILDNDWSIAKIHDPIVSGKIEAMLEADEE
jgi:hypothetical protein